MMSRIPPPTPLRLYGGWGAPQNVARVTVIGQRNGEDEEENWLVFRRPVSISEEDSQHHVEAAFRVENGEDDKKEYITKAENTALVVFFPTEKETKLGFLIQGPYRTTPARDNIHQDDKWNCKLIDETAGLVIDALHKLKKMGLLSVSLLEALPIDKQSFYSLFNNNIFHPIYDEVLEALTTGEFLPTDDGTFVSAQNAKLARSTGLRELLCNEQLRSLFQTTEKIKWLSGEITYDRTPGLHAY